MSSWKDIGKALITSIVEVATEDQRLKQLEEPRIRKMNIGYTITELTEMSTAELRKEVYAIYQEISIWDEEKEDLREEARKLYYDSSRRNSPTRYRAKLMKFLFEKGHI